eukprot:866523_1
MTEICLRIGWANAAFLSLSKHRNACGDDDHSWGWNGISKFHGVGVNMPGKYGLRDDYFRSGHVVGCCIDTDQRQIKYYLNNQDVGIAFDNIHLESIGVFPCVS